MSQRLAATLVALALAAAGGSTVAHAASAPVPGPRQRIEHVAVSGAQFGVRSGTPQCYTGAGAVHRGFEIPAGSTLLGLTAYVVDGQSPASIHVELQRHDLATGGSYVLAKGDSVNGQDTTIEAKIADGHVVGTAEGVNAVVTIPSGTCFKGAVLHYLLPGAATADDVNVEDDATPRRASGGVAPDGSGLS